MKDRPPNISLSEMRTLVAISETGTFTAAAGELGISQPAVSRQLTRVEQRLGTPLFEREFRYPRLTPFGKRLLAYAREMIGGFDEVMSTIGSGTLKGELRLETSTTLCQFLLPDWIQRFNLENPEVKLSVLLMDSQSVEEDVLDGTADLGFVWRIPIHSLPRQPVAQDEVVLAVPETHPFASRGEIGLEELLGQPFIARARPGGGPGPVTHALKECGLEQPDRRIVMNLESDDECLQAVSRGVGVSWITNIAFSRCEVAGVVPVRLKGFRFRQQLYLIHANRPLTPVGRAFVTFLRHQDEPNTFPRGMAKGHLNRAP